MGFLFSLFALQRAPKRKIDQNLYIRIVAADIVGYYDGVLWAYIRSYNKNKTTKNDISRPDNENLTQRKLPTIYGISNIRTHNIEIYYKKCTEILIFGA